MTYKMQKTQLTGFPIQYGPDVVHNLNNVSGNRMFNNMTLKEIGTAVSGFIEHSMHPETNDNYTWFGKLEFALDNGKVAVLFPWSQDWNHPETQQDRSINVYSNKEISECRVKELLEELAYTMALYLPRQRRELNRY